MTRKLAAFTVAALAAGCGSELVDPCVGHEGRTCIGLQVRSVSGELRVDQLIVRTIAGPRLSSDGKTPASPLGSPVALPVAVALDPPDDFAGAFSLTVGGFAHGALVGRGSLSGAIERHGRQTFDVFLYAVADGGVELDARPLDDALLVMDGAPDDALSAMADAGLTLDAPAEMDAATDGSAPLDDARGLDSATFDAARAIDGPAADLTSVGLNGDGSRGSFDLAVAVDLVSQASPSDMAATPADAAMPDDGSAPTDDATSGSHAAPQITSVSPGGGSLVGGTSVLVSGAGFYVAPGLMLTFNGAAAGTVRVLSPNTLSAITPASSSAGLATIKLTNPDGQSVTSTSTFKYLPGVSPSFAPVTTDILSCTSPTGLVVGDFVADGVPDVVVACRQTSGGQGALLVLKGLGDGTFTQVSFTSTPRPAALVAADFNGDGKLDVATIDSAAPEVFAFLGDGKGALGTPLYTMTGSGGGLATGDLNSDGKPDLVLLQGAALVPLLGVGDGTFAAQGTLTGPPSFASLALGDLDGDGHVDLVGATDQSNVVVWYRASNPTFLTQGSTVGTLQSHPRGIVVADFDADGRNDVIVGGAGSEVSVLHSTGKGGPSVSFASPVRYTTDASPLAVVVGDFDKNGRLDFASANFDGQTLTVYYGDGVASFSQPSQVSSLGGMPVGLVTSDFNRDGLPDLATVVAGHLVVAINQGPL